MNISQDSVLVVDGQEFRFNDHVCMELLFGVPDEKRTGRLVQVRKGCGQFGSNVYLVRRRDGSLGSFENVQMRRVDDERFVDAFYRSNGRTPPEIPEQEIDPFDSVTVEYKIGASWPETGFIIEKPAQPETPGCFGLMISSSSDPVEEGGSKE